MSGKRIIEDAIMRAQNLETYDVGESIESLALKTGKKRSEILKLNSNENLFIPLEFIREILRGVVDEIDPRIYPRDEVRQLKEAISENYGIPQENIIVGGGSDQLIDLLSKMFLKEGDEALSIDPTFVIYRRSVRTYGASYRSVPLKEDFSLDVEAILSSTSQKTKIIFLCSPNNPTANQLNRADILSIAEGFDGLVAIDETYADFSGSTLISDACESENIVVLRTFSKVFGLAGLRIGYAVTNRKLASALNERYQMPYPVSTIALKAAIKMLEKADYVMKTIDELKIERSKLIEALDGIPGVKAFPSETNFVLFQVNKDSSSVYRDLLNRGIIVRDIGRVLKFNNCLRVTVAPNWIMTRFINELRGITCGGA